MYRVGAGPQGFPEAPCLSCVLKEMEELVWRQEGLRYSRPRPRHEGTCHSGTAVVECCEDHPREETEAARWGLGGLDAMLGPWDLS